MNRTLALTFFLLFIVSCTAHRPISHGVISESDGWLHTWTGLRGETEFQSEKLFSTRLEIETCNYGDKHAFAIVPPFPLAKVDGPANNAKFAVAFRISTKSDNLSFAPSLVTYTSPTGKKLKPTLISTVRTDCPIDSAPKKGKVYYKGKLVSASYADNAKRYWKPPAGPINFDATKRLDLMLLFDTIPPTFDENFQIEINGILEKNIPQPFPRISYSRDTMWGGW